ncbi:MAG: aldehyde dehydrogenase family protein [Cytophagia bacterium]|nr:MAG: aldehyde dehydrogenase family protein [Runella sp.]TAG21986.1 MAG: aldehyde dehydrogenase family protein [Cytophagales bacterium]TAG38648.1 MAG: aldehyde dehydrogenase family protein [Cytophagia bacterium]TAG52270.1 MAG: aldehyde dehydrogenase family protein [Runella slithyformis]TAG82740.1 MAG: aldehyde dehydrogenase family protein [Cytophagales bacterium]
MKTFPIISPVDGSIFLERRWATGARIESVLQTAKIAQKMWQQTPLTQRVAVCQKMLDYFLTNAEAIGQEITWQMGRPISYTPNEIKRGFKERTEYMISIAERNLSDIAVSQKDGFQRFIRRQPIGTVLVLAPWNYPYLTSVNVIVPAILAGNSVILKHAEQTPLCAERYAQAFEYAGLPEGVFQYLHTTHDQVAKIVADPRVDYVAFTGSVAGGHAVQKAASGQLINVGLELGGKDPAYVRADADLDFAIENIVDGALFNSGQSCCGVERVYVHQSRFDDFVAGCVALTNQYVLGNPLDITTNLGPMVRTSAAEFVRAQVNEAVAQGAKALIDPAHFAFNQDNSPYLAPQILVNVNHNMRLMTEETFGPVVGIMPVKDDAEAIDLMNDSAYGLTASVWTNDLDAAMHVGSQIETGTFFMNRCDYLDPELAWTGIKNSGRGCTLSTLGYEALTRPKSFHLRVV